MTFAAGEVQPGDEARGGAPTWSAARRFWNMGANISVDLVKDSEQGVRDCVSTALEGDAAGELPNRMHGVFCLFISELVNIASGEEKGKK